MRMVLLMRLALVLVIRRGPGPLSTSVVRMRSLPPLVNVHVGMAWWSASPPLLMMQDMW